MNNELWTALVLVREGEMCKGRRNGPNGEHCAIGFLNEVNIWDLDAREIVIAAGIASDLFPERVFPENDIYNHGNFRYAEGRYLPAFHLAAFNNHPDTVKADLELVFEKAAIQSDELVA